MSLTRIKVGVVSGAVMAALVGVALSGGSPAAASATRTAATVRAAAKAVAAVPAAKPAAAASARRVTTTVVGHGRVDAVTWSVALEYYNYLPKGYTVPVYPAPLPGGGPHYTGVLCERMYLNGVRIDHQGGPWADCGAVVGTHQALGDEGLWGFQDKGTSGVRLFVGENSDSTAYAVLTFTNGRRYQANSVHVPGTAYSAFAVPIGAGRYISSVDTYDAHHHRLRHETYWH